MNVNKIEIKLDDIAASSSALAGGVLQMLDASVSHMSEEQALQFVAGTLASIAGGLAGRIGFDAAALLLDVLPKMVRDAAAHAEASAKRKH